MKLKDETYFCKTCFKEIKEISLHSILYKRKYICRACFQNLTPVFCNFKIAGKSALAIYEYTDFIKEKIYLLKGAGDIEIATIFLDYYRWYIKLKYLGYYIIGGPSSPSKINERGFEQNEMIFNFFNIKVHHHFEKVIDFKQSDLKKEERNKIIDKLKLVDIENILRHRKILLVDDIFTTGSTIQAMIKLLENIGTFKIKVLVLSIVKKHTT